MSAVRSVTRFLPCLALVAAPFVFSNVSRAGTVILEGSDAIGLHCTQESVAGACTYEAQTWKALDGASGKPIAAIGDVSGMNGAGSGITVNDFTSVAAAGTLSNYAALYFIAGGGCCNENDSLITAAGAQAAVSAYLAGGGTVMIEDYTGGTAWDFAVGAGGNGNKHVAGFDGGLAGPTCTDNETVTATGTTNGFTQPPAIGCWEHQAYDQAFFGPLGFTKNFFAGDPAFAADNPGFGPFSGLLSNGSTLTGGGGVPEPASVLLIGLGLVGLGTMRFRRKATK